MKITVENQNYEISQTPFDDRILDEKGGLEQEYVGEKIQILGQNLEITAKTYKDEPVLYIQNITGTELLAKKVIIQVLGALNLKEAKLLGKDGYVNLE